MNALLRRTFLKVGAALVGGVLITRYTEPLAALTERHTADWITDKGDYYIVRVPEYKTFATAEFEKPVIFIMGQYSTVQDVDVHGYANVFAPDGGAIRNSKFDASKILVPAPRPVMLLHTSGMMLAGLHLTGNSQTTSGIQLSNAGVITGGGASGHTITHNSGTYWELEA